MGCGMPVVVALKHSPWAVCAACSLSGPMTPLSAAQAAAFDSSPPKLAAHGFLKRDECRPELAQQLRVNTRAGLERLSQRQGLPLCVSPRVLGGSYTELSALREEAVAAECACAEAGGPAGLAGQAEQDMVPPVVMAGPGEKLPVGSGSTGTASAEEAPGEGLVAAAGPADATLRLRGGGMEGVEGHQGAYQAPQVGLAAAEAADAAGREAWLGCADRVAFGAVA